MSYGRVTLFLSAGVDDGPKQTHSPGAGQNALHCRCAAVDVFFQRRNLGDCSGD